MIPETTLIYLEKDNKYLFLYRDKKKNDLNKGYYIGVGGHIEKNETPEECLVREVKEETGLDLVKYHKRGVVTFINDNFKEIMHLYTSTEFNGEMIECDEGHLIWIDKSEISHIPMWEGDKVFLEFIRNNEPYFELNLVYSKNKLIETIRTK